MPYVAMTMQLMDIFNVTPELIRDPLASRRVEIAVISTRGWRSDGQRFRRRGKRRLGPLGRKQSFDKFAQLGIVVDHPVRSSLV